MRKHFYFRINWRDLEKISSIESVIKNLHLPKNKFPPRIFVKKKDFFVAGYFVSYNPKVIIKKLVSLCRKKAWEEIAAFNGDFLILYCDMKENKIFVISDQTGKFPCYFSTTAETIVLSTSFYDVFKSVRSPSLDIGKALEFIYRDIKVTDKTVIREVQLLPPATLGEFKSDGNYEIKTLLEINKFMNTPFKRYSSLEEFGDVFLETLDGLVKERLETLSEINFSAEISSGFDSSLICYLLKKNSPKSFISYCEIAKAATKDTQSNIVKEFARKHDLGVKFVPYDHFFPFSTKDDFEWIRRGPSYIQKSQAYNLFYLMKKNGNLARFTGDGGDEAYWSNEDDLNLEFRFPLQKYYFENMALRRYGVDKVLTEKGLNAFFDKERFRQKNLYPLFISHSAVTLQLITFPLYWETEVWPMSPYMDTRLIQIARGIPSKGEEKRDLKQEIWKGKDDIFTEGQFREKGGTEEQYKRFLTEKKEFAISVLKSSLLGEKGWVKSSETVNDISKGKIQTYYEGEVMGYLINLLELEYFIQQNNVKVP